MVVKAAASIERKKKKTSLLDTGSVSAPTMLNITRQHGPAKQGTKGDACKVPCKAYHAFFFEKWGDEKLGKHIHCRTKKCTLDVENEASLDRTKQGRRRG